VNLLTYVATKNRGKLAEFEAIFAGSMLELRTYADYADVAEGETSFEDNALLKARALAAQLSHAGVNAAVLADDSGLEVEALGGRPGVLSARYAGANATWEERRRALLAELRDVSDERRGARFVCVIAFIRADGQTLTAQGTVHGRIAREEQGTGGFGYDPIFIPDGETQTFSEMGEQKKNAMSHRRRAADALLERLRG
jgi:non-canonical purine NTP pyrophosphatase (RdgB/HAM1 family)